MENRRYAALEAQPQRLDSHAHATPSTPAACLHLATIILWLGAAKPRFRFRAGVVSSRRSHQVHVAPDTSHPSGWSFATLSNRGPGTSSDRSPKSALLPY